MSGPAAGASLQTASARVLCEQAQACLAAGDAVRAAELCRRALAIDANCVAAHLVLSSIALPGEYYLDMLRRIHAHLQPRTYLEIGVNDGASIALCGAATLAIGVDPAPRIDRPLPPGVRIVRETSDDFFSRNDLPAACGGLPLDLAFIDGLHRFEYALRDFINIERNAHPATRVLIHDCYPLDEATSTRDAHTYFWSGDVWKLVLCLRKYRPDLQLHTLAVPPTGLCLVRGLDPGSTVLSSRLQALYSEFVPLPYSALGETKAAALNLVPGDWGTARGLLG
jgi:hypothetical protein